MTAQAAMLPLERPPRDSAALPLFDFQRDALTAVLDRYAAGVQRQVVSIPTGGGKTVLACHIVGEFGRPAVFMCHRDELVKQTFEKFRVFDPGLSVAVCKAEQGRTVESLAGRDVVIASAQTLAREARLATLIEAVGTGGLLLVDEAHHAAAETWTRAINALDAELTVGLTATPKRGDGLGLDGLFQEIVYAVPLKTLVEWKPPMLARPVGVRIGTGIDLDGVRTRGREFVESDLAVVCNSEERNRLVVDAWETHARGRAGTVAFCVDVAHVAALTAAFRARGHQASAIVGTTPDDERGRIYAAFRAGCEARENPVLVSCLVLTEGWDEPLADTALMCRPTQSQALYVQMAGRVLRRAMGKHDGLILDFVDATRRHQLQTIWTLAGEERGAASKEDEEEEGVERDLFGEIGRARERKARVARTSERLGDLLAASDFVWHANGERPFAPVGQSEWITVIQRGDEGFLPARVFDRRDGEAGFELLFSRPVDVDTAMLIAEKRIPPTKLTDRTAGWRQANEPATEGQYRAARFLRLTLPPGCTKGQASELLDRGFEARAFKRSGLHRLEGEGKG